MRCEGFFGGSGQRSHAELKRSAPGGRPQGGMVCRVGVSLATSRKGGLVPPFFFRHNPAFGTAQDAASRQLLLAGGQPVSA